MTLKRGKKFSVQVLAAHRSLSSIKARMDPSRSFIFAKFHLPLPLHPLAAPVSAPVMDNGCKSIFADARDWDRHVTDCFI